MAPPTIGACLKAEEIADHRDWLFDSDRDIEIQDFMSHASLSTEYEDRITAARAALNGHKGRVGMHGPFDGLDMDNKDPELRSLITARYIKSLEAANGLANINAQNFDSHQNAPLSTYTGDNSCGLAGRQFIPLAHAESGHEWLTLE